MPAFESLYEEINTRIEKFYKEGSILTENKYIVGFYGENVKKAFDKMQAAASARLSADNKNGIITPHTEQFRSRTNGVIIPENTYTNMFERWRRSFVPHPQENEVELRWTASNVVIPSVKATTVKDFSMDSTKTIWYPLITGSQTTDKIIVTVVEERGMGMYQFFNALMNTFFTSKLLKPKSSFQKLAMYIVILNGEYIPASGGENMIMDIPLQIFEFNSIVPVGISTLTFKQGETNEKVSFTVEFEAPNIFQGSYASTTVRGLMDNTTDEIFFNPNTDNGSLNAKGGYMDKVFTLDSLMDPHNIGDTKLDI